MGENQFDSPLVKEKLIVGIFVKCYWNINDILNMDVSEKRCVNKNRTKVQRLTFGNFIIFSYVQFESNVADNIKKFARSCLLFSDFLKADKKGNCI